MDRAAQLVDWGSGMKVSVGCAYHQHLLSISNCHMYCPGCGGTRAVITLAHGEVFRALYDNFAAPMTAAWAPIYMASQTVWSLRKEPGWDLHYDSRWLRI